MNNPHNQGNGSGAGKAPGRGGLRGGGQGDGLEIDHPVAFSDEWAVNRNSSYHGHPHSCCKWSFDNNLAVDSINGAIGDTVYVPEDGFGYPLSRRYFVSTKKFRHDIKMYFFSKHEAEAVTATRILGYDPLLHG